MGGSLELALVDEPALAPLSFGLPTAGWQGDHALAVYSWPARNAFVLMRLEVDGVYRIVRQLNSTKPLSPSQVNALCIWLVAHDREKGFDPHASVMANNDRLDAEKKQADDELVDEELAPRLEYGIKKDMGQHLGGTRFDHALGRVPWHEEKADTEGVT